MNAQTTPRSTCAVCGSSVEEASDLGCVACWLNAGFETSGENARSRSDEHHHHFGAYVIERRPDGSLCELGRGAMGVTYLATDETLRRRVALKLIPAESTSRNPQARERFMRGARAAAALRHENVATVYHFGIQEETGQCFYAMELVEGETLEERVRRCGPLSVRSTIAIAQQVADALAAAETRRLVHRDLKPSNLMLVESSDELKVKVIDFGLAKAISGGDDPMWITRDGFAGTPAFASPEQFAHQPIDIRSDIYSLGVTLWFALTGEEPYPGRDIEEIRRRQEAALLPVAQLRRAGVRRGFVRLLRDMLALHPAMRPTTAELLSRLRKCGSAKRRAITMSILACLIAGSLIAGALVRRNELPRLSMPNEAAQFAYENGVQAWNERNHKAYKRALEYFDKAIALYPNYAKAYAGLSLTYPLLADDDGLIKRSEDFGKARAAAAKAIGLDAKLAEPHAALALVAMNYEYDWDTANREFQRAIELNPKNATAHHWYAECLAAQGQRDPSIAEIRIARQLDPKSRIIQSDEGKFLFLARRYGEAVEVLRQALATAPDFVAMHDWLAQAYHEIGRYDDAISEFNVTARRTREPWSLSMIGRTLAAAGRRDQALQMLNELQQIRRHRELEPQFFVPIYIALGEHDEVFALLEKEYEVRSTGLISLKSNPLYDGLRSDPRFVDLMRRVHLAP